MKVILANGKELELVQIVAGKAEISNIRRDEFSFIFDANEVELSEIDALFTEENCATITTIGPDGEFIYNDYIIRTSLVKKDVIVQQSTPDTPEIRVPRVIVSMAQMTYQEKQMKLLEARLAKLEG